MLEVELKFALDDPESLLAALIARGATPGDEVRERDVYFAHPSRDFGTTDEAFRLRWDGRAAYCTYKGPLLDRVSKSREEVEFELASEASFETARLAFGRLGFREVRGVEKTRRTLSLLWQEQPVLVAIDEVQDLGLYVELETLCEPADFERTRDQLLAFAESLGLRNSERRSYLQLLLGGRPSAG